MSNQVATQSQATSLRDQMTRMGDQFKAALPSHIAPEKFQRVAMTAINRNPDLQRADRATLFEACMLAAQDGLLPDGREAALVIFKTKVDGSWIPKVQYMPMVYGIRKKVYQSGEIKALVARIAYEGDDFDVVYGLDERIDHKPNLFGRGQMIASYAVATFRDGTKEFDVMTIDDVEKVRKVSKNGETGPWRDWYEEMAKKTVIRRLAKTLPLSAELDDFMRRDDGFYDLGRVDTPKPARPQAQPQTIEARLDNFAGDEPDPTQETAADSNAPSPQEEAAAEPEAATQAREASGAASAPPVETSPTDGGADVTQLPPVLKEAMEKGRAARRSGHGRDLPKTLQYKSKQDEAAAFLKGWDLESADIQAEEAATV